MDHAWLAKQTASLTFVVYFTMLSQFQLELQDGRQMIWKEAVEPKQGIPVFTLNVRKKKL
jgi:hypothetical protein